MQSWRKVSPSPALQVPLAAVLTATVCKLVPAWHAVRRLAGHRSHADVLNHHSARGVKLATLESVQTLAVQLGVYRHLVWVHQSGSISQQSSLPLLSRAVHIQRPCSRSSHVVPDSTHMHAHVRIHITSPPCMSPGVKALNALAGGCKTNCSFLLQVLRRDQCPSDDRCLKLRLVFLSKTTDQNKIAHSCCRCGGGASTQKDRAASIS